MQRPYVILVDEFNQTHKVYCAVATCPSPVYNDITSGSSPNQTRSIERSISTINTGSPTPPYGSGRVCNISQSPAVADDRGNYGAVTDSNALTPATRNDNVGYDDTSHISFQYDISGATNLLDLAMRSGGTRTYTFYRDPNKKIQIKTEANSSSTAPLKYAQFKTTIMIIPSETIDGHTYSSSGSFVCYDYNMGQYTAMIMDGYTGTVTAPFEHQGVYFMYTDDFYCPDPLCDFDQKISGMLGIYKNGNMHAGNSDPIITSWRAVAEMNNRFVKWIEGMQEVPQDKPWEQDDTGGRSPINGGYEWGDTPEDFPSAGGDIAGTMVHAWFLSKTQVEQVRNFLWSDTFIQGIKALNGAPIDGIIGLYMMPVSPTGGSVTTIHVGNVDFGIYASEVSPAYYDVAMGSVDVPYMWGNFLDFSPYTRAVLYLPFIGEREIPVDECMGGKVEVKYRFDMLGGKVLAMVKCSNTDLLGNSHATMHYWSADCAYTIPVSADQFNEAKSVLSAITSAGMAAAGGKALSVGLAAENVKLSNAGESMIGQNAPQAISDIVGVVSGKQELVHTGSVGANFGYMSEHKCILRLIRPTQSYAKNTAELRGLPSNMYLKVGDQLGFISFTDIRVDIPEATDTERQMIREYLQNGIYIN